jgi:hypothetical protein
VLVAGLTEVEAQIAAVITGFAGIIAATGGVLITLRSVRNREQKAVKEQIERLDAWLADERVKRIAAEQRVYQLALELAQHGIVVPDVVPQKEEPKDGEDDEPSSEGVP